jgi:hypothetical protein
MAGVRITLDRAGIRADANRFARPRVTTVTRQVLNRSAIGCPVDSGRLRASGRMKVGESGKGPRGVVEYPVKYAAAVEDGSGPHVIRARKKKALRFKYGGRTVIVKSVKHPGTKARPFLTQAAQEVAAAEGLRFIRRR